MDELTENCVGSDGCLKYFTIAFYTGNKLVFESAHYGYEIYWLHTGFAEMGFMMTLAKIIRSSKDFIIRKINGLYKRRSRTSSFGKKRSGIFVFHIIFLSAERCPIHPFPVG